VDNSVCHYIIREEGEGICRAARRGVFEGESTIRVMCHDAVGGRLYTGCWHQDIVAWDVRHQRVGLKLHGHTAAVNALCLTPSRRLFSGSNDKTVRAWDSGTGLALRVFCTDRLVKSIVVRGEWLMIGSSDGTVKQVGLAPENKWDEVLYLTKSTNATAICIDGEPELVPVLLRSPPGVSKKTKEECGGEGGGDPFFSKKDKPKTKNKLKWLSNCGVLDREKEDEDEDENAEESAAGEGIKGFGAAWEKS